MKFRYAIMAIVVTAVMTGSASNRSVAAPCGDGAAGFPAWLEGFKQRAIGEGISGRAVEASLGGVAYSRRVIGLDRNQSSFKLSFEDFWRRRVSRAMIQRGRDYIAKNAAMMGRIEARYNVPPELLVAIWALETGFGREMGDLPIMRSLATLAYDCRRSEFFTRELLAALKIVERGDLTPARMVGAWAGEIGQTQFLAERYLNYAVDFDGDGKRDLNRSVADALASTANWFAANGWRAGASWEPGSANYEVIGEWNRADVYKQTIARLAQEMGS